jgi:hypothetical protein
MLLLTLQELPELVHHRLIRERLLYAGGAAAYSHLLTKIGCGDPLNLSSHILQSLGRFLDDFDICEAVHEAGVTSQLLDLVPRYVLNQSTAPTFRLFVNYSLPELVAPVADCIACVLFGSETARTFVETRTDLIPLTHSTLTSSEERLVKVGMRLCICITKNPALHTEFIDAGLCTVLVDIGTRFVLLLMITSPGELLLMTAECSTRNKAMMRAAFAALTYLTDLGGEESIQAIVHERALQRIQWRVFPVDEFGSNDLSGPMHIISSVLGSEHFPILNADRGLGPAIFRALR